MINRRARVLAAVAGATVASMLGQAAQAADYTWSQTAGGTYAWNVPANWSGAGFPNAAGDTGNLSVGLTGNLLVNVPSDVTLGTLTLGGTAGPVTTDIGNANAGGGVLLIDNGVARGLVNSVGVAGSVNRISAPIRLIGQGELTHAFEVTGTNSLVIDSLTQLGAPVDTGAMQRTIENHLPDDLTLTINNLTVADPADTAGRRMVFRGTGTTVIGTIQDGFSPRLGVTGGNGTLTFGLTTTAQDANLPTYIITGNNTGYTGITLMDRGTIVFGSDNALGTNELRTGNPSNHFGFNIASTDDARQIPNDIPIAQNTTYRGDHSITMTGFAWIRNNRDAAFMNLLPEGKTLTWNGSIAAAAGSDNTRRMTFDGPGLTVVNGNIYNHRNPYHPNAISETQSDLTSDGVLIKNGTGTLLLNSTGSTYDGQTIVSGGYLQFASPNAYGVTTNSVGTFNGTSYIVLNRGAATGVLTGSTTPDFLNRFTNVNAPTASTGGLALAAPDAAVNLDFTGAVGGAVNMSHANTVGMSVGAVLPGTTYTGTITPAAGVGYRLGGGGKLTLPNSNALTGSNPVAIVNGGTVAVTGTNNYTGATSIRGNYVVSSAQRAEANANSLVMTGDWVTPTLEVTTLANGGSPSSIGSSNNSAANLSINGGVLKYVGSGSTTDRGFVVGPVGATLDASGTGAVVFNNSGAVGQAEAQPVTGTSQVSNNIITNVSDINDLAVGMTVSGGDLPAGTTITGFQPSYDATTGQVTYAIRTSANATTGQAGASFTFGNQARTLNLTGSNTGANTIAGALGDSATGSLSVNKTGAGTWNLTGAQSYTGSTDVSAGRLVVASNLTTTSAVNVTGGTLQLAPGAGGNRVIKSNTLNVTGGAIDLSDNKLITASPVGTWTGSAYDGVSGLVDSGRGSTPTWNGPGIITSDSRAQNSNLVSIGVAKIGQVKGVADTATTTFAGQTVLGSDTVAMVTYGGDATLDGKINIDDYGRIDANVASSGTVFGWYNGDFNYDGAINIDDYGIIDGNISQQTNVFPTAAAGAAAAAEGVSAVPEPASLSLLAMAAMSLVRRRRRTN